MRFCCCFKLSKKIQNCQTSSRHTPLPNAHWLAWCNRLRNLIRSEIWSAQHCFLPLPRMPVGIQNAAATSKKQKTLVCIREIQVHKLWTKVYSQKGLTAMAVCICGVINKVSACSRSIKYFRANLFLLFIGKERINMTAPWEAQTLSFFLK